MAVLMAHPEVLEALGRLAGAIDNVTMQRLNHEVDEQKRPPALVAERFLKERRNPGWARLTEEMGSPGLA